MVSAIYALMWAVAGVLLCRLDLIVLLLLEELWRTFFPLLPLVARSRMSSFFASSLYSGLEMPNLKSSFRRLGMVCASCADCGFLQKLM